MKITRKILENIIIEETKKMLEQDGAVYDLKKKETRPMLDDEGMRTASMQELEEEYLGFGCKTVAMSSSDGAIIYCERLQTAYEEKALQKGMSAETLKDISEQNRPTANDASISTIAFRQEVLRQLQYIVDKLIIDRDATLGTKAD